MRWRTADLYIRPVRLKAAR